MVKTALAVFLTLWTPVQAAEPAFDALNHLLREYAGPVDEKAAEAAPETDAPKGERLAKVSADLALMAAGLETFRAATPAALPDDFVPELKSFFKDRDSALSTVYRTLAVTDYTWALRFEGGDCGPRERRAALLADSDGLFASDGGDLSPWLLRLLGPSAKGKSSSEALDRASRRAALSARDYELLRAKAAKIEAALRSEKAEGAGRAKLYCRRGEIYESLAGAHRVEAAPIAVSRATEDSAADSVFLMVWSSSPATSWAVGAGVMIETPAGPKVFTDSRLRSDGNGTLSAVVRGKDGRLGARYPFKLESVDNPSGVMVGRVPGADVPALKLATGPAALSDLVRAIGHVGAAGSWSTTQGLVTEAKAASFASDAIMGPDMLGSPLLNEAGEIVGLVVLTPGGSPVAIRPERLLQIAQSASGLGDVEFASARQSGSASLLTTALPIVGELRGAGGEAVAAGLPSSLGGVNWEGGGGVGNWRPHSSAGPPSGYSSYSSGSSSYSSSDTGGAELGRALGQALAPLVEALIFKGIPALFRGIGSLFKSKPKAAPVHQPAKATVKQEEKKPEPPPVRCRFDKVSEPEEVRVDIVELRVRFSCDDAGRDVKVPLEGHTVTFDLGWQGQEIQQKGIEATTDSQGYATFRFYVRNTIASAERSLSDLDKYDPDKLRPDNSAEADNTGLINTANSETIAKEAVAAPIVGDVVKLTGQGAFARSTARIALRGGAVGAVGTTLGEVAVTGAVSAGFLIVGGTALIFTVKNGLDNAITAQDKYNKSIDTHKDVRSAPSRKTRAFDALDKESQSDDDKKECKYASSSQLASAGISDEHAFKEEHDATPNAHYDICACRDGSIIIRAHGSCGYSVPFIPTEARWR